MQLSAMPILSNQRRECFAQHVARGENGTAAYRHAYGAQGASAEANASRLLRNDKVRDRVRELQTQVEKQTLLTMQRRRELLCERAERPDITAMALVSVLLADARLAGDLPGKASRTDNLENLPSIVPRIIVREPGDPGWRQHQPPRAPHMVGEEPPPLIIDAPRFGGRRGMPPPPNAGQTAQVA